MNLHAIILAAGKGSRMKSELPKVLHTLAGKPMLHHVVATTQMLKADGIHIVIGHGAEKVKLSLADQEINWATQEQQLGTGHAVMQAMPEIPEDATVLILYGDVPLIHAETLSDLLSEVSNNSIALLTAVMDNPHGYGRVIRNAEDKVTEIVEQKDANPEQLAVNEVNTGIVAARAADLNNWLPRLSSENAQKEYYLTDIIAMAIGDGKEVKVRHAASLEEVQGVNDRLQLSLLERFYQRQAAETLLSEGVMIYDPARFDVRGTLTVGQDVEIDINCIFEGQVSLGDGVKIGPNCVIKNTQLGKGTEVKANSSIEDSVVAQNAVIGPYARLRPGTNLADNTKIGNFVETKKALIGKGSKVNHLSYIGDADIGENVNIGAGTITCNYDGVNKYMTQLGDGVFVGSNSSLVAPVKLGKGATVGAGSVITKDVPEQHLAVGRGRQKNVDGWQKPKKNEA